MNSMARHMLGKFFKMFAGGHYTKFLKKCQPIGAKIDGSERESQNLTDKQLNGKTCEFRVRLAEGETVDDSLPQAFGVVKNAARKLCGTVCSVCGHGINWDMVHYDVQLIGGSGFTRGK